MEEDPRPPTARLETEAAARTSGPLRWALLLAGFLLLALGVVGAFLPILPTTPFVLLAIACLSRSSPAWQRRIFENRVLGPYARQWQRDHSIPRDAKRKAYGLVVLSFTLSIALVDGTGLRLLLGVLGVALIGFLAWLPTTGRARG